MNNTTAEKEKVEDGAKTKGEPISFKNKSILFKKGKFTTNSKNKLNKIFKIEKEKIEQKYKILKDNSKDNRKWEFKKDSKYSDQKENSNETIWKENNKNNLKSKIYNKKFNLMDKQKTKSNSNPITTSTENKNKSNIMNLSDVNANNIDSEHVKLNNINLNNIKSKSIITKSINSKSITPKSITPKSITAKSITPKSITAKSITAKSITAKSITAKSINDKSINSKSINSKSINTNNNINDKSIKSKSINTNNVHSNSIDGSLVKEETPNKIQSKSPKLSRTSSNISVKDISKSKKTRTRTANVSNRRTYINEKLKNYEKSNSNIKKKKKELIQRANDLKKKHKETLTELLKEDNKIIRRINTKQLMNFETEFITEAPSLFCENAYKIKELPPLKEKIDTIHSILEERKNEIKEILKICISNNEKCYELLQDVLKALIDGDDCVLAKINKNKDLEQEILIEIEQMINEINSIQI